MPGQLVNPTFQTTLQDYVSAKLSAGAMGQLQLYSNDFTPSPISVIGDFTECTFTGYAAVTGIDFTSALVQPDGSSSSNATTVSTFSQTGTTVSQLAYGWLLLDNAGTLIGAGLFPTPINFDRTGANLSLVPYLNLGAFGYSTDAIQIP